MYVIPIFSGLQYLLGTNEGLRLTANGCVTSVLRCLIGFAQVHID